MMSEANQESLAFASLMEQVAQRLLGEPNKSLSKNGRLRFGSKGSIEVDTDEGWFCDYEAEKRRGGVLDLIEYKLGCDRHGSLTWLEEQGLKERRKDYRNGDERVIRAAQQASVFYDYCDENGEVLYRVERRKPLNPPFLQHGPDGRGGFRSGPGCMKGVRLVPYRLPELLAADPGQIVFFCEGEKDADRIAGQEVGGANIVATTNPGGAGNVPEDFASYFAGRRVVALEDNDSAGARHVARVRAVVSPVAAEFASLRLPGGDKADVSDWLAEGGSMLELLRLAKEALANAESDIIPLLNPADWDGVETPERAWALADYIPDLQTTLWTGKGSTGKSKAAQLLCTCAALGIPFLGVRTDRRVAIYLTWEDDAAELHIRQKATCAAYGLSLASMGGRVFLQSLAGELDTALATFDEQGNLRVGPFYPRLAATAKAVGARLLVLDNSAHVFTGNENDRHHVAAFMNLLNRLAREIGGAVVLIGHPNKAGDSFSGSTAWENQVRSRLFMEAGESADPDQRVIRREKSNYARNGEEISFRWHAGTFILDEDLPPSLASQLAATAADNAHNERFLACLRERNRQQRAVSERPSSTYAPKVFESMPEAKGSKKRDLILAMDRLFRAGLIERGELWRDDERKLVVGLRETVSRNTHQQQLSH